MGAFNQEWLVTDQRGAYAMGTSDGIRTRKYHGFFMGDAGRSQKAFLVDLDFVCDGISLWPHCYSGPEGLVFFPDLEKLGISVHFELCEEGPQWHWILPHGKLKFSVRPSYPGGIQLSWSWSSKEHKKAHLCVRGFWGMRDLHSLGGASWSWKPQETSVTESRARVEGAQGKGVYCLLKGAWKWTDSPQWNQNFHYSEELQRGYAADENLFSAGTLESDLNSDENVDWLIAEDENDLSEKNFTINGPRPKICDFVVTRPAGIIAGFPWFGEWGRDTFISLPGIISAFLKIRKDPKEIWPWARELLHRWGTWIDRNGMLPNVIEKEGVLQWESADATLWWCHSLAELWMFSLCVPFPVAEISLEFNGLLGRAIESIRSGHHRFLKESVSGTLEVTEPHVTWMDAKVDGMIISPRIGALPEINALWFEARCLQWLWSEEEDFSEIEELGKKVLQCQEADRPNTIFLHSLPLAPSFVLKDWEKLERDLIDIAEKFWTPVGLMTLSRFNPHFRPRCVGTQEQRDRSYHQGPAWAWLGGNFEIARHRLVTCVPDSTCFNHSQFDKMFTLQTLEEMPVKDHIPELFDSEPPFTPRGAPAQAWSLACLEEAKARRRMRVDSKISKILAQRWLGRSERKLKGRRTKSMIETLDK